jgi:flavin-dependent dehydrogenase
LRTRDSDVCVIGGGPAGSCVAARLAELGHRVRLVERSVFPRPHIGESLPPSITTVLDVLDVRGLVEGAGFLRPTGAIVRWSQQDAVRSQRGEPGFQVDRAKFDHLLLRHAMARGVDVIQPATARRPTRVSGGWGVQIDGHGELRCKILVDASGKRSGLSARPRRVSAPTAALFGYWRNVPMLGPETRVEAGEDVWYWGAPLPDGTVNAVAFIDMERCQRLGRARADHYRATLARSTLLSHCLAGELIDGRVQICDASSYLDDEPARDGWLKIGEAAMSIDPLSSQGVQAAMMSAFQAAAVAHTMLTRPDDAGLAQQFLRDRVAESAERHGAFARDMYAERAEQGRFWRERADHGAPRDGSALPQLVSEPIPLDRALRLSPDAALVDVPTLEGHHITRHRAVTHPSLDRPVAFVGGVAIAPLCAGLKRACSPSAIAEAWSAELPPRVCRDLLHWLWSRGIVISAAS